MTYEYTPHGVCSRKMILEIEGDIVKHLQIVGGCNGNGQGIAALVRDMKIDDVIARLEGIRCNGKPTSCPGQLAEALRQYRDHV